MIYGALNKYLGDVVARFQKEDTLVDAQYTDVRVGFCLNRDVDSFSRFDRVRCNPHLHLSSNN